MTSIGRTWAQDVSGFVTLCVFFLVFISVARADVVVIANRTPNEVQCKTKQGELVLPAGGLRAIPVEGPVQATFHRQSQDVEVTLNPGNIYFFRRSELGQLDLHQIALPGKAGFETGNSTVRSDEVVTIRVKIFVDDEERAAQKVWEDRLRRRLQAASETLEQVCRLKLAVVDSGSWDSDDAVLDFQGQLRGFEKSAELDGADVAIGFSSQLQIRPEQRHLGGTRLPLHSHILIGEWFAGISEAERLEILLHELGHYLGAAHSPELDSLMRPKLGDGRARQRSFRLHYDALNVLAMNIVTDEIRAHRKADRSQLSLAARERLRQIYAELAKAEPNDPAAKQFLVWLNPTFDNQELIAATRKVVQALTDVAQTHSRAATTTRKASSVTGDDLAELYLQTAAKTASELPPEHAGRALILGLGIASDGGFLRSNLLLGAFCEHVESNAEFAIRKGYLGQPSLQGRPDLYQHFVVAAFLTGAFNRSTAELASVMKECRDAQGGSGFSFADLTADYAGIQFATAILDKKLPLKSLGSDHTWRTLLPDVSGAKEGLTWKQFTSQYGSLTDARFNAVRKQIISDIMGLKAYRQ